MSLKSALKYIGLSQSRYLYKSHPRTSRSQPYRMDPELKEALLNLKGYELTLGYYKTTTYLYWKHERTWNKKKVYPHMKALGLLQPRRIKRRWIENKRLPYYNVIQSNVRWEADLTYVPTAMGNVPLFVIMDAFDKELLGGQEHIMRGSGSD